MRVDDEIVVLEVLDTAGQEEYVYFLQLCFTVVSLR